MSLLDALRNDRDLFLSGDDFARPVLAIVGGVEQAPITAIWTEVDGAEQVGPGAHAVERVAHLRCREEDLPAEPYAAQFRLGANAERFSVRSCIRPVSGLAKLILFRRAIDDRHVRPDHRSIGNP